MSEREVIAWYTANGKHIPIFADNEPTENEKKKEREIKQAQEQADRLNGKEKTDQQMEEEMKAEFERIDKILDDFIYNNPKNRSLDTFKDAEELGLSHIEKTTLKDIKWQYLEDFNKNVQEYGNGFEYFDNDMMISILYADGTYLNTSDLDGTKKIPLSNIQGVIVDSGWGTAVAGKSIELYNYREQVDYGKYGYKSVKERYDDFNDIRADFTVKHPRRKEL